VPASRPSNLCFDGSDPLTRSDFQGRELISILDTGDEVTEFRPPFARQFAAFVTTAGTKGTRFESGYSGEAKIDEMVIPELPIRIGGSDVSLRPAHDLPSETVASGKWYFASRQVTIDFHSFNAHAPMTAGGLARRDVPCLAAHFIRCRQTVSQSVRADSR